MFGLVLLQTYGMANFGFFIFSLLFQNPKLKCLKDGQYFECPYIEACRSNNFTVDLINSA
jgi:hypothetical protein